MSSTKPTARPPKAPTRASVPSTPGPEAPGGYPRNSVVFADNQWDRPTKTKKPGLLAATKVAVASYFSPQFSSSSTNSSSSEPRLRSPGHTPGVALRGPKRRSDLNAHTDTGSDSSRGTVTPTPGDFPTPGGQTFSSRSNWKSDSKGTQPDDYFNLTVSPPVDPHSADASSAPMRVADTDAAPAPAPAGEEELADPGIVPLPGVAPFTTVLTSTGSHSAAESNSTADPNTAVEKATLAVPQTLTSPASSASDSSGSRFSTFSSNTHSTAPTSLASPSSLGPSPDSKPGPAITYAPSTSPSRPVVTKTGSAAGRRLSMTVRRFASVSRRRGADGTGIPEEGAPPGALGHGRGVSLDSSARAASSASGTAVDTSKAASESESRAGKRSSRVSLLRTLRGEAAVFAGRVRGDKERVERGKRMLAGEV